jgi:hypothetical protein
MRKVSDRSCGENQTHNLCTATFSKNRAVYEIMRKVAVQPDAQDNMEHVLCTLNN